MEKKQKIRKRFLIIFWSVFSFIVLSIVFVFVGINKGWIGYMPPIDELQNPQNKYASEIYSADMEVMSRFFYSNDNRVGVTYNEISENVINALVATEDVRFYDHAGVDGKALGRAIFGGFVGIFTGKQYGGGSTLTQQLAKQLYSPNAKNFFTRIMQKPIEWVIAVKLERLYSKEEIITMYLNQFDFLHNAIGIKSAAQVYFSTTPDKLSIEQAATLVGMCKNPSLYNPISRNENSTLRRNVVMHQMLKDDMLTQEAFDSLKVLPLEVKLNRIDHSVGIARYFREYLRLTLTAKEPKASDYADWQKQKYEDDRWQWENNPLYGFCNKNRKPDGSPYNIYTDGLKIYTTIDTRMQKYAEEAVEEHMKSLQDAFFKEKKNSKTAPYSWQLKEADVEKSLKTSMGHSDRYRGMKKVKASDAEIEKAFNTPARMSVFSYYGYIDTTMTPMDSIRYHKYFLRCGMISVDANNGHVKAYVGGPNFNEFKYDMATQGRRQIGSTVKPFLYTLAMDEGMSPCDRTINEPITVTLENGKLFTPRNGSKARLNEEVTLRWGLSQSNNWITAYVMTLFTPQSLANIMRSFGVRAPIDPVFSLAFGPNDVSVAEMVGAYTSFPNKGIRFEPLYVTRIDDSNGNTIHTFEATTNEVFSETTSYKMISMLRGVIDRGTGARVRSRYGLTMPAGGKTGTTQNNSDGWFIGFTPTLVSGVWVGGEERGIHFDRMSEGQGASMALPIWALYMKKVLGDESLPYSPSDNFKIPTSFDPNAGCKPGEY